jgi:hypothetical protein
MDDMDSDSTDDESDINDDVETHIGLASELDSTQAQSTKSQNSETSQPQVCLTTDASNIGDHLLVLYHDM